MKIVITGATGLIGNAVAKRAAETGHDVTAIVRDVGRAKSILPPSVALCPGDITEPESLPKALQGAEVVIHTAGMPEQWQADESIFTRVNVDGTVNILRAAKGAGVRRVVYTSTMDVFAAPPGGTLVETNIDPSPKPTAYERSKQAAEREAETFLPDLDIVFMNPSAVYGPSPVNLALNSFFIKLITGQLPLLPPGGASIAYIDGVAAAFLAAAERGRRGERYLLSDCYVTNAELAAEIVRASGMKRVPGTAPTWLMKGLAAMLEPPAKLFRFTPLIARGQLSFLLWQARVDSSKARRELGFTPTPLEEGVQKTVRFLRDSRLL